MQSINEGRDTTATTDRRWTTYRPESDDNALVQVVRGLAVRDVAVRARLAFREALATEGLADNDAAYDRWWPAADQPSAREIAQSVLRG